MILRTTGDNCTVWIFGRLYRNVHLCINGDIQDMWMYLYDKMSFTLKKIINVYIICIDDYFCLENK